MANSNFVVHNGLTVGSTTITALTGEITKNNVSVFSSLSTLAGNVTTLASNISSLTTTTANSILRTSTTGSAIIPSGNTAQRDSAPVAGYLRYNQTISAFEGYSGNLWVPVSSEYQTNLIYNGGFTVNQRGYVSSANIAVGGFGHDRWKGGAAGGTYSFSQLNSNTTITVASGKSLIQVIAPADVQFSTYTLSWSGNAQGRYGVNTATPAGSYVSSPILIEGQSPGVTMSVEFNTGTLGNIFLNAGPVITTYVPRTYQQELALCQRFYVQYGGTTTNENLGGFGYSDTTTTGRISVSFPVQLRATPTLITNTPLSSYNCINGSGASTNPSNIALGASTTPLVALVSFTTTGLVAGQGFRVASANAAGYLGFSSEL